MSEADAPDAHGTLAALYHATIVEHDRAPHNHRALPAPTHAATVDNPLCGDVVTVHAVVAEGALREVAFEARGCALSRAAGSLMTTLVTGQSPAAARALAADLAAYVRAEAPPPAPELAVFAGVHRHRSRRGCVTLPFRALVAALASAGE